MNHINNKIRGWFNFAELYTEIVKESQPNATFVEVGTWMGKSATYMAVEIANSNKNIEFYCVDLWSGVGLSKTEVRSDDRFYQKFLANIEPVKNFIKPVRMDSVKASATFPDNFFDFIFIDASHDYESVKLDINSWYPKLKTDGVYAGHDYYNNTYKGVRKAVDEFANANGFIVEKRHTCWKLARPNPRVGL